MTNRKDIKNKNINIRIDNYTLTLLRKKLLKYDITISEYIRYLIIKDISELDEIYEIIKKDIGSVKKITKNIFSKLIEIQYGNNYTGEELEEIKKEELKKIMKTNN